MAQPTRRAILALGAGPVFAATAADGGASASPAPPGAVALRAALQAGELSAEALVQQCLARIERHDRAGPRLNAVIELNPDALDTARALDARRAHGDAIGPLHGLPVLLKDNIASGDRMFTSAGSLALTHGPATRDAHLVARLRAAGAVVLGKTNLSEWANIRSTRSSSGWSSRGGFTRNPHDTARNTSGSSSGAGAAAAAALAPLNVGTETDGSITSPAHCCGAVGFKPTVGVVSRDGVIPISTSQDTAGPMTRSVADAALLLAAMAGADARDSATARAPAGFAATLLPGLATASLRGARLGVVRDAVPAQPSVATLFDRELQRLREAGATLVEIPKGPNGAALWDHELVVLLHEMRGALPRWLREFAPTAPVKDLASLIAWNSEHAAQVMPFFDQELFEQAEKDAQVNARRYARARAACLRLARREGLDPLFTRHRLDALLAPTGSTAWLTDTVLGDHYVAGGIGTPLAVAGYPHLTVPMGLASGLPVGLSFGGPAFSDARLLALGHAYEQVRGPLPLPVRVAMHP
ncbi:amidase, Asp-tRNAAsn/Glu-tRNAGln amidotransferase A subunit [Burkholderiales bacterium JOSHI_001]|nr:amidase, Asp-tRNAAsn/Glu-tRNAGln amidotransferase A subunit [Burkholderiales bacterium JOSHI_001]